MACASYGQRARVLPKPSKAVVRSIEMQRAEHGMANCSGADAHSGRHLASGIAGAKIGRCLLCPQTYATEAPVNLDA